jgi:hypothetical protein
MLGLYGLLRDLLVLGFVAAIAVMLSYTNRTFVVEPPPQEPEVAIIETPVATTTSAIEAPTSTPPVATTTTPVPTKPIETVRPVLKPADTKPKVEDLNITLNDAIQSISSLAAGQSSTSQSVNDRVRAALVNILCTTSAAGPFESISGSGVLIDPRGVVLTNAHVAQFFLLKNYPTPNFVTCVIRTGSPAYPRYTAELMYLPPQWIADNAKKLNDENPTGTGERDYALLRITGGVSSAITLPPLFPFLLIGTQAPDIGSDVLQAGYAAGFLGGITVQNELYASSAWTKIRDVYTFNANTVDLFSLGGSIVAQRGSSGGPVTNTEGVLQGVIVTSTQGAETANRDLRAISTAYIIRDFSEGRGKSLQSVLSTERLADEVDIYNRVYAPIARQTLITELEK